MRCIRLQPALTGRRKLIGQYFITKSPFNTLDHFIERLLDLAFADPAFRILKDSACVRTQLNFIITIYFVQRMST